MNRPASVLVFGIINLIFAAMGLCGAVFGAISLAMLSAPRNPRMPNPALDAMQASPAYMTFNYVTMALGLVATIVIALAGIGLLMSKSWGRHLSIGWAVYTLVMTVIGLVVNYVYLISPLMEKAGRMGGGPEQAGLIGGIIGGLLGTCLAPIYPVILLIFMFRPNLVAYLNNPSQLDPYGTPPPPPGYY